MDVGDVQRFNLHQRGDFQRPDMVVDSVCVVAAGMVTVKTS